MFTVPHTTGISMSLWEGPWNHVGVCADEMTRWGWSCQERPATWSEGEAVRLTPWWQGWGSGCRWNSPTWPGACLPPLSFYMRTLPQRLCAEPRGTSRLVEPGVWGKCAGGVPCPDSTGREQGHALSALTLCASPSAFVTFIAKL